MRVRKYELSKKGVMKEFFSEIEVFRQEKAIYQISDNKLRDRQKIRLMTKKGHQKFSALKWTFFP